MMAMTVEQRENEQRLHRWTYFLSLAKNMLMLVFAYAATKLIDADLSFVFVFAIWTGLWVCDAVSALVLRPWVKPHQRDCVDFDIKTRDRYIDQLEREANDKEQLYLDLLSERSQAYERIDKIQKSHRKEMDDFEYHAKESIRTTLDRMRDGRCKDVEDELEYMLEHFDVYRLLTR